MSCFFFVITLFITLSFFKLLLRTTTKVFSFLPLQEVRILLNYKDRMIGILKSVQWMRNTEAKEYKFIPTKSHNIPKLLCIHFTIVWCGLRGVGEWWNKRVDTLRIIWHTLCASLHYMIVKRQKDTKEVNVVTYTLQNDDVTEHK